MTALSPNRLFLQLEFGALSSGKSDGKKLEARGTGGSMVKDPTEITDVDEMKTLVSELPPLISSIKRESHLNCKKCSHVKKFKRFSGSDQVIFTSKQSLQTTAGTHVFLMQVLNNIFLRSSFRWNFSCNNKDVCHFKISIKKEKVFHKFSIFSLGMRSQSYFLFSNPILSALCLLEDNK